MKKKRRYDRYAEEKALSLTSLIDVTFLLLVFFLLTLQFRTLDGKLATYLPKDAGQRVTPEEPTTDVEVVIRVVEPGHRVEPGTLVAWDGEGRYELEGRVVSFAAGPRPTTDVAVLERELARLRASDPERRLKISARVGTVVADTVAVVDVAVQVGYTDITFAGRR